MSAVSLVKNCIVCSLRTSPTNIISLPTIFRVIVSIILPTIEIRFNLYSLRDEDDGGDGGAGDPARLDAAGPCDGARWAFEDDDDGAGVGPLRCSERERARGGAKAERFMTRTIFT